MNITSIKVESKFKVDGQTLEAYHNTTVGDFFFPFLSLARALVVCVCVCVWSRTSCPSQSVDWKREEGAISISFLVH